MIKNFNLFLNESLEYNTWYIFSGIVNELNIENFIGKSTTHRYIYSFILTYSNKFIFFKGIKNTWSVVPQQNIKRLKQIKKSNIENSSKTLNDIINVEIFNGDNIDYLDISDQIGYISYLSKDRLKTLNKNDNPYNNRFRQKMKIGKFFIKYSIFDIDEIPKKSIDIISNIYKYITKSIIEPQKLEIVEGEEIRYWYNGDNYANGYGPLNKSCMKDNTYQKVFDIYVNNPEVCKLVILRNEKNKLLGRALLWKTNQGLFMDRVYTVNDHDFYLFNGFAISNKWMIKDSEDDISKKLTIQLKKDKLYKSIDSPYLDTFKYFFKEKYQLCNYRPYGDYIILNHF